MELPTKSQVGTADPESRETQVHYDAVEERRVRWKLDRHMMPLFFVLCKLWPWLQCLFFLCDKVFFSRNVYTDMLAFLDRSNIGNAEIAGMAKDLHLDGNKYSWLLTIFYITYIVFEFSLLFWKIFPPHIVGTFVVFAW